MLQDASSASGIAWRHYDGSRGRRYIVETVASGLATLDFDGDGLLDIYFLAGAPLRGSVVSTPPTNRLYRNLGDGKFADVTQAAGVGDPGFGLGVTVADYDDDGDTDVFVGNDVMANFLFQNDGKENRQLHCRHHAQFTGRGGP